jgi:manganese/zinc/iron transport system permease protein
VSGFAIALAVDASVAGSMATMCGVFFAMAHLFAPQHGIVTKFFRRRQQRVQFASDALTIHLLNHERTARQAEESAVTHLISELRWTPAFAEHVINWSLRNTRIETREGRLSLTSTGRENAQLLARTL